MASTRVFDTVELLEAILTYLTFDEIAFTVPLVCKQWKSVIDNSISLQRASFRIADGEPILPKPGQVTKVNEDESGYTTPVLQSQPQRILTLFEDKLDNNFAPAIEARPRSWHYHHCSDGPRSLHTLRLVIEIDVQHSYKYTDLDSWYAEHLHRLNKTIRMPPATRSMYLSQPPITAFKLRIALNGIYYWELLYDKAGLRLGHVADIVAQLLQQYGRSEVMSEGPGRERLKEVRKIEVAFRVEDNEEDSKPAV